MVWRMSGVCLDGVWRVSGEGLVVCLEVAWMLSGWGLELVWRGLEVACRGLEGPGMGRMGMECAGSRKP